MHSWTSHQSNVKLVNFLFDKLQQKYSLRKIKRAIENNHCRVNGVTERFYTHLLSKGDRVELDEKTLNERQMSLDIDSERILFEDEHLLIYNKPSGIASDFEGVGQLFPSFTLIHRLDKETTGCLMFAKYPKIKTKMISLFKENRVSKSYLAVVDGVPKRKQGVIENFLGKISSEEKLMKWGPVAPAKGLRAKTTWTLEKRGKEASLLKLNPISGRTHQLRVHCQLIGHPILGDFRYSRLFSCKYLVKRTLLHSYTIRFPHPVLDGFIEVKAPIPPDMKQAIRQVC